MNRTLLLILCDFLLLNLLALTRWEKVEPVASQAAPVPKVEANAAQKKEDKPDSELVKLLKTELEKTTSQRAELERQLKFVEANYQTQDQALAQAQAQAGTLSTNLRHSQLAFEKLTSQFQEVNQAAVQTRQQADQLRVELADRDKEIQMTVRELAMLEQQKRQALALNSNLVTQAKVAEAEKRLLQEQMEKRLQEAALAKEEAIKAKQAELEKQARALAALALDKQVAQEQVMNLNARVQATERERTILLTNLTELKTQVASVRQEKQQLQNTTERLTDGVQALAVESGAMRKEFRDSQPITVNQMFTDFLSNRVDVVITAEAPGLLFGSSEKRKDLQTLLVKDNTGTYAVMHVTDTPFALGNPAYGMNKIQTRVSFQGRDLSPLPVQFSGADPRLLLVPVNDIVAELARVKVYTLAQDPFRFPSAVLISKGGRYYGETEFRLDPRTPNFVQMKTRLLSRLFGEFSPSVGDLVLSKSGELLGVMVNSDYCVVLNSVRAEPGTRLDETMRTTDSKRVLEAMKARLDQLPFGLQ